MAVLVGDGLKVGKSRTEDARREETAPGVRLQHKAAVQSWAISCQAVGVIVRGLSGGFAALPLAARIHEGVVFSNRDKRTLLDKMIELLDALGMTNPCYFVADAYYASARSSWRSWSAARTSSRVCAATPWPSSGLRSPPRENADVPGSTARR